MKVSFLLNGLPGVVRVENGKARVSFPDPETAAVIEETLNTERDVTYEGRNIDGSPRITVTRTVPAHDDGTLIYVLKRGMPGTGRGLTVTGVEGSDKVSFRG